MRGVDKVLGLIPARGGSKGVPRKNLQKVGGKSLMELAVRTAVLSKCCDRVLVSSEDEEIRMRANKLGEYAPFVRPRELAQDKTPSLPVFQHAIGWAEKQYGCRFDWLLVLEPPCPFRLPKHLRQAMKVARDNSATSVVSLVEVEDQHPVRIKRLDANGKVSPFSIPEPEGMRRQDQEPAFIRNGAVYVFSRDSILSDRLWGDKPFGFLMERELYGVNIDAPIDLELARILFKEAKKRGELDLLVAP